MINLCRNDQRLHVQRDSHHSWHTFALGETAGLRGDAFDALASLNEIWLSPGRSAAPLLGDATEVVSYVHRGSLAQEDTAGEAAVVQAGEFQRMVPGHGVRHKETNASASDWAEVFRIGLRPLPGGDKPLREQRRFAAAQRRNLLCVVASPDGRQGSLRIRQDALIISSVLDPGHHLIHPIAPGRRAWLHIVHGEALLHDLILSRGDGMGVVDEAALSLTARELTEVLIIDLPPERGGTPARD